jgi:hypothetical protein
MECPISLECGKIYGMTNGSIDQWDKTLRGKAIFKDIIELAEDEVLNIQKNEIERYFEKNLSKELFSLMKNDIKSTWGLT